MNITLQHTDLSIPVQITKDEDGFFAEAELPAGIADHDGPTTVFASGPSIDEALDELRQGIEMCLENQ